GVKVDSTGIIDASISSPKLAIRAVTAQKLADRAVTPAKTSFITRKQSKNLYDKATSLDGQYVNESGRPQTDSRFTLSQLIEVTPGQPYFGKATTGGSGMRFTSYYTEAGTWVSGGPINYATTFTPPAGVRYVRISILVGEKDAFQLE
ncbi:hypothetical protein BWI93_24070, partial [Siphonobacter sp. BAB-5385]|uniref:hypothetical protein n=1 Tax=Siphonobacter sp. BAB-5385 TaxID=1864822 RepID=UPI000BC61CB1